MDARWKNTWTNYLTLVDQVDLTHKLTDKCASTLPAKQFAPEYSQYSYVKIKAEEIAITNYVNFDRTNSSCLDINTQDRASMVELMHNLNTARNYRIETFYWAVEIFDRYLASLTKRVPPPSTDQIPKLPDLATLSILIAAKLNQPVQPAFDKVIRLLPPELRAGMQKKSLIDLERQLIFTFDFDFQWAGPLPFLHRFERLLEQDRQTEVCRTADTLLLRATICADFLSFPPS